MKTLLIIIIFLVGITQNCLSVEKGMASWYGTENSRSSTGKSLYNKIPAAAHKTLPIGTMVKITSIKNNRFVIAVIEDRGPYTKGRIVDVNRVAASQLGILKSGITKVTVEKVINQ